MELWELDEKETLIVNKFCKYEHDDMVEAVDVLAGSTRAVSGGRDFRRVLPALPSSTPRDVVPGPDCCLSSAV